MKQYHYPETPIKPIEIQRYIYRVGIDCAQDSRAIMATLEDYFGCKIKLASFVLAALWCGYCVIPHNRDNTFRFVQVEV